MAETLENGGIPLFNYHIPKGGYYIWCNFPKTISQTKLWAKAAGKGVAYTPGNVFYPEENDGENYIRLNFTFESDENIRIGVQKLLEAAEEAIKETEALDRNDDVIFSSKPLV
jgi:DNA-binding transcriptional MocR family regulator